MFSFLNIPPDVLLPFVFWGSQNKYWQYLGPGECLLGATFAPRAQRIHPVFAQWRWKSDWEREKSFPLVSLFGTGLQPRFQKSSKTMLHSCRGQWCLLLFFETKTWSVVHTLLLQRQGWRTAAIKDQIFIVKWLMALWISDFIPLYVSLLFVLWFYFHN